MNKLKLIFVGTFLFGTAVKAQQDVHYSQFYTAPTYLNPATAGAFNADLRFFSNYRTQWKSLTPNQFKTITASFDAPIRPQRGNNHYGAGITFYNDKAGDGQVTTNNFALNGSYVIEVEKKQYLSLGLGVGLLQRSISFADLYWDNQWNGETFDASVFSGENGFTDKFQAIDLSGGLYYYGRIEKTDVMGGISVGHINRPNVSFLGQEDKLLMKYTLHGGADIPIPNSKINVMPNLLVMMQGPNRVVNVGSDFKYLLRPRSERLVFNDEVSMALGTYYRVGDAAYFTARFNYAGLSFGAAYDLTVSELAISNNGSGGMEFFVSYAARLGQSGGISMFR